MIDLILHYKFMQYALISAVLASVVCGIIGVVIIEKKLVMMSGGIAHTAYGGVGLGYLCNFEPILGALIFAVIAAFGIGSIKRKGKGYTDVVIGLFWSMGMALGVIFIALTPGYPPNIDSYLFGSILSVTTIDLYFIIALTVIVLFTIILFYNHWMLFMFDAEFAKVKGVKTTFLQYALLVLIALTVVVLIRVVGIILVMALLCAPAATASMLSHKLKNNMIIASVLGIIFSLSGLYVGYLLDTPAGATIAIIASITFFTVYLLKLIIIKKIKRKV